MPVRAIPEGYHSLTPYLSIKGAAAAIDFYKEAFGATEVMRMDDGSGGVGHAELRFGDSVVMLADFSPAGECRDPQSLGGVASSLLFYVEDVEAVFARAVAAGAKVTRPVDLKFYGDRSGTLIDPFGHVWTVATHVEDVSPGEMERRMAAMTPPG